MPEQAHNLTALVGRTRMINLALSDTERAPAGREAVRRQGGLDQEEPRLALIGGLRRGGLAAVGGPDLDLLAGRRPGCVIAMNPIYRDEIRRELDRLGVAAPLFAV